MLAGNTSWEWALTASATTHQLTPKVESTMLLCTLHHTSPPHIEPGLVGGTCFLATDPFYWT